VLTLPKQNIGKFLNNEEVIYAMVRENEQQKHLVAETAVKEKQIIHTVRKGEKLATVAKKYGVSVADLKSWNFVGKKGIKPVRKLNIYVREKTTSTEVLVAENKQVEASVKKEKTENKKLAENASSAKKGTYYKIKKGDTLYKISKEQGVSMDDLKRLNKLTNKSKLSVGQKIVLR
jgi:membrane-bound lytic murein transglycosylase D